MKSSIKKLFWVTVLTFLIPPAVVAILGNIAIINTPEFSDKLVQHWSFYTLTAPFFILTPFLIRSMVNSIVKNIETKNYKAANRGYSTVILTYTVIAISYGLMALVITPIVGASEQEIKLGTISAIFYTSVANMPFLLKFIQYLDEIFADVPKDKKRIFKIKNKFRLTTIISSFAGIGLLSNAAYTLAWRMVEFPEMGITPKEFAFRIVIIGFVIMCLQIAPNFILGSIFTKHIEELKRVILRISQKDLTIKSIIPSRDEFGLISDAVEILRKNLRAVISEIKNNSKYLRNAGLELSSMANGLSEDSTKQAAGSEEIASSVEEMSANINLSSEHAEKQAQISKEAKAHMAEGKTSVDKTLLDVQEISDKVKYIEEIASQTNMLAINAYVEAANAGSYGEGFSVIAKEVRSLADKSRDAATEIIQMTKKTLESSKIAQVKISSIVPQIDNMSSLSAEIANAAIEQRSGSDQINEAIQAFNDSSQRMASSSEELSASSNELQDRSVELDESVSEFIIA